MAAGIINYQIHVREQISAIMKPRDRVRQAMEFQETDRMPTAICGGPYGIVDDLYHNLLKYFSLGAPVQPFRKGHNISFMDDRILDALGTDFRYVYPTVSPSSPIQQSNKPNMFLDAFGQVWERAQPYYYAGKGILSEITSADQIDELVTWPDPASEQWFSASGARAKALRESTDFWITARMVVSHGPFQYASDLRGMENFLLDMVMRPELASVLINKIGDIYCGLYTHYLVACGEYIDMIELPGDDYAGKNNLIVSPDLFRKFIKPVILRIVQTIRTYREDIKIMLHSDGAISKIIPDIIDTGIDVLHPLEPLPATNQAEVKREYHGRLVFLGGVDITHALQGTKEGVISEVHRVMDEFTPGGGFVFAPSNHLQADIPPENIALLFQQAQTEGRKNIG